MKGLELSRKYLKMQEEVEYMKRRWISVLAGCACLLFAAVQVGDIEFFNGHVNGKIQGFDHLDLSMFKAGPEK